MGHATYKQIMGFNISFPSPGKSAYGFSTRKHPDAPHVKFSWTRRRGGHSCFKE